MRVMSRLPLLAGVLLFASAPLAFAESPLGDPIAPAVIGRPLWEWARPVREKPAHAARDKEKAAGAKAAKRKHGEARASASARVARQQAPAFVSAPRARAATLAPGAAATPHVAKQALDDRVDPRIRVDDVGKGSHFARKPLAPGVYFGNGHRAAVRKYFEAHPLSSGAGASWKIGEPVPQGMALAPVPGALLADLPKVPPGHQYVRLGGDVLLIAAGSKMVVDGISQAAR